MTNAKNTTVLQSREEVAILQVALSSGRVGNMWLVYDFTYRATRASCLTVRYTDNKNT